MKFLLTKTAICAQIRDAGSHIRGCKLLHIASFTISSDFSKPHALLKPTPYKRGLQLAYALTTPASFDSGAAA